MSSTNDSPHDPKPEHVDCEPAKEHIEGDDGEGNLHGDLALQELLGRELEGETEVEWDHTRLQASQAA